MKNALFNTIFTLTFFLSMPIVMVGQVGNYFSDAPVKVNCPLTGFFLDNLKETIINVERQRSYQYYNTNDIDIRTHLCSTDLSNNQLTDMKNNTPPSALPFAILSDGTSIIDKIVESKKRKTNEQQRRQRNNSHSFPDTNNHTHSGNSRTIRDCFPLIV